MNDEYLAFAKNLAEDAGKIMLQYFRANDIGTKWKKDNTPITIADITINDLVIDEVKKTFPDHGVWGEEQSHNIDAPLLWVCDPVDGTMPFSLGIPISTFSIALVQEGVPIVGVVKDPFCNRLFYASKGGGAYLNGEEINVSKFSSLKNAYINMEVWGVNNFPGGLIIPIDGLREKLMNHGALPFTLSSMVISGALVAGGELAGSIFGVRKPEDIAAIKVIVEEAGGKVTDLDGNDQQYNQNINGAIVSNGQIHQKLIEIIKK
jgi:fructose-1,6-bisphosphatase/inositol monophosphatase family enzyme